MDSLISAAAQALAEGNALGALKYIALRNDAPALALRGIAMAQLGDLGRARSLLRNAVRSFDKKAVLARARCTVAEAEIALASRDLTWPWKLIETAQITLEEHGDLGNAAYAHYINIRRLFMTGCLDEAERTLAARKPSQLPPALSAIHQLTVAGIAIWRLQAKAAHSALAKARQAANQSRIPALLAEVESLSKVLNRPLARLLRDDDEHLLLIDDVERLLASKTFVVDACRFTIRCSDVVISLASRPVLFTLARQLAEAWPQDVARDRLIAQAFRSRCADETYRARLRVEITRLRKLLGDLAGISATKSGFILVPHITSQVAVLTYPVDDEQALILALLSDGETWSSSALALALGMSQRTVQRALNSLGSEGKVQALGNGRSRRWTASSVPTFATAMLLPPMLLND